MSLSSSIASSFSPSSSIFPLTYSRRGREGRCKLRSLSVALQVAGGSLDNSNPGDDGDDENSTTAFQQLEEQQQKQQYVSYPSLPSTETPPPPPSSTTTSPPSSTTTVTTATTTTEAAASTVEAATTETDNSSSMQLGPNAPPPGWLRRKLPNFPWRKVPDMLTYCRCLAIPLLCILFYMPSPRHVETALLFALASFTDWLDGFLARRWDISTKFGAFLDPVADKLMVSTALILLSGQYGSVIAIPTCIILARELAVSALREWMAQRGNRDAVQVGFQGKVKTALTMIAITFLLLVPHTDATTQFLGNFYWLGLISLYFCTAITVTSGSVYFRAAAPFLLAERS